MQNWTITDMTDQAGRVVLVTGANSGIGFEMARAFAQKNAHVIMACRNLEKGRAAFNQIKSDFPQADLDLRQLDLGSLQSVREFAAGMLEDYERLHILINNAGLMAIPRQESPEGFEMQFAVNHLGHFALTGLLLPLLKAAPGSRVVTVSSMVSFIGQIDFEDLQQENRYTRYGAYGQSKLANILFAFELQRRFAQNGLEIQSVPAHPGYSATNLQSNSTAHSGSTIEKVLYGVLNRVAAQSSLMGALPELYAATAPDVQTDVIYGPRYFYLRGYPEAVKPPKPALDVEDAHRLWELSEALTGVYYDFSAVETAEEG